MKKSIKSLLDKMNYIQKQLDSLPSIEELDLISHLYDIASDFNYKNLPEKAAIIADMALEELAIIIEELNEEDAETTLILELPIGKFPKTKRNPKDYGEYLYQSDHLLGECKIVGVKQL